MILGAPSPCFQEIDEAVAQLQAERGDDRPVVFGWQLGEVPRGAIIYNFDFPGTHFGLGEMREAASRADEVWDFSLRGASMWKSIGVRAKHVPVGYHPSMSRFERRAPVTDVAFVGSLNPRRWLLLETLRAHGLVVVHAPESRSARDAVLASCRASVNLLYYENGIYPALRAAHLLANDVPYVGERCAECEWDPTHAGFVSYDALVDALIALVEGKSPGRKKDFMNRPMVLPT